VSDTEQNRAPDAEGPPGTDTGKAKKPYQKPAFQHERVFETMALACGKLSPTQFQCRFNRKNS
jgi:hypothetical protein